MLLSVCQIAPPLSCPVALTINKLEGMHEVFPNAYRGIETGCPWPRFCSVKTSLCSYHTEQESTCIVWYRTSTYTAGD